MAILVVRKFINCWHRTRVKTEELLSIGVLPWLALYVVKFLK